MMMRPHSHSELATMTCRACGQIFDADVWTIVDVDERLDLREHLRAGTLHLLRCPHCGQTATVNAPLLILRPSAEPPLLFSPARGSGHEQEKEQVEALVGMCRIHLEDDWREDWLANGLHGVARDALPLVLGDDPDVAAALATAAQVEDEVSLPVRVAMEQIMRSLSTEGVRVQSSEDLRIALEQRPELKRILLNAFLETPS